MKGDEKTIYIIIGVILIIFILLISVIITGMAEGSVTPIGEQIQTLIGWN